MAEEQETKEQPEVSPEVEAQAQQPESEGDPKALRTELLKERAKTMTYAGMLRKAQEEAKRATEMQTKLEAMERNLSLLTRNAAGEDVDIPAERKQMQQEEAQARAGQEREAFIEARRGTIGRILGKAGLPWEDPRLAAAREAWAALGSTGNPAYAIEAQELVSEVALDLKAGPEKAKPALTDFKVDTGDMGGGGRSYKAIEGRIAEGQATPEDLAAYQKHRG